MHATLRHLIACAALAVMACAATAQNAKTRTIIVGGRAVAYADVVKQLDNFYKLGTTPGEPTAQQSLRQYRALAEEAQITDSYEYTDVLQRIARDLNHTGKRKEAAALLETVVRLRRGMADMRPGNISAPLSTLATIYNSIGQTDTTVVIQQEALDIDLKVYGAKSELTARDRTNLAAILYSRGAAGDLDQAIALAEQSIPHLKADSKELAQALNSLSLYYATAGNSLKAADVAKKALQTGAKAYGKDSQEYAATLSNHSVRLARAKSYTQAIEVAAEAERIFAIKGEASLPYAKLLSNTASYLHIVERLDEAIDYYQRAIQMYTTIEGEGGKETLRCKNEIVAIYNHKGDTEKAEGAMAQLTNQEGGQVDTASVEYARLLRTQAATLASMGNHAAAEKAIRQAISLFTRKGNKADAALSLTIAAGYAGQQGKSQQADDDIERSIALYKEEGLTDTPNYAQALNTRAILLHTSGHTQQAAEVARTAAAVYEQRADTLNSYYARLLANLAVYDHAMGHTDEAITSARRSLSVQERMLGKEHPDNVMSLFNLAVFQKEAGRTDEMVETYTRAVRMQTDYVRRHFAHLTSREREMYWAGKAYVMRAAPDFAYSALGNDSVATNAYNTMLFTKGLLLNSEIDFRNLLSRSKDKALAGKFEEMVALNRRIDEARRPDAQTSEAELRRMKDEATRLDREVVSGCKELGDWTKNLSITTREVAGAMQADEVAVEFMRVRLADDDYGYAALILRKGWAAPRLVHLFTQKQLGQKFVYEGKPLQEALQKREGINRAFADPKLGDIVWKPLIEAWGDGVKSVWFSPDGMMYQWGVEYLLTGDGTRISDRYEMHRVSSTKQLAWRAPKPKGINGAAIFGGLDYDLTADDLLADHEKMQSGGYTSFYELAGEEATSDIAIAVPSEGDDTRAGRLKAGYLPGTRAEAEHINMLLLQNDIASDLYPSSMAGIGSEEQFKSLSGQGRNLIHVATHGFCFLTDDMVQHMASVAPRQGDEAGGDQSMSCSGLLMAGANLTLGGGRVAHGVEDGILTAREISLLDLRGLRLVVLSACNTGMGEIKDEGVFGLQRGFKKAGAETLMMSLWSVSDAATQQMMSTFYEALIEGKPLHEAHREARKAVAEAGFDEPYYWASFIMLD